MEHRTIFLVAALLLILLGAGCVTNSPPGQNSTLSPVPSDTGTGVPATETIDAHFPAAPLALPQEEQFAAVIGSFDDTYIGSMDCSNGSETFETNYTYFSGAGSPRTVTYQLVPVNYVQGTDESPPAGRYPECNHRTRPVYRRTVPCVYVTCPDNRGPERDRVQQSEFCPESCICVLS